MADDTTLSKRRRLLQILGAGATSSLAGCPGQSENNTDTVRNNTDTEQVETKTATETETTTQTTQSRNWEIDPVESDHFVGAYYYGWYDDDAPIKNPFTSYSPSKPTLGNYSSANPQVINQHIKWAREAGINTFLYHWWGPDTWDDINLREVAFQAELWDHMKFVIQPSPSAFTPGFGNTDADFDKPGTRNQTFKVFEHLEREFFHRDDYATIRGRPPVVLFGLGRFSGDFQNVFLEAMDRISADPYIIMDSPVQLLRDQTYPTEWVDASTIYHPYKRRIAAQMTRKEYFDYIESESLRWRLNADRFDLDWIPSVLPGFDDHLVRDREGRLIEPSEDRFRKFIQAMAPKIEPDIDTIFVTSFNEWYEDTVVEPSEDHGEAFLNIVRNDIATASFDTFSIDERFEIIRFEFNTTFSPENADRDLAFRCDSIRLKDANGEYIQEYDIGLRNKEPILLGGAYGIEQKEDSIPENWRWFGGSPPVVDMYIETDANLVEAELTGISKLTDQLEVTVSFDGTQTDTVALDKQSLHTYTVSLE